MRDVSCSAWFGFVTFTAACSTDEAQVELVHDCPYTEVGTVAGDDPGEIGFSPADVLAAASVSTSAETVVTEQVPESYVVELSHTFSSAGDALLVDYGEPADSACPAGLALWVPAQYTVSGSVGAWSVSAGRDGFSLVATAAEIDAISSDYGGVVPDGQWDAEVDQELEDLARQQVGPTASPECEMSFSLGPMPDSLASGTWATEVTDGWLSWDCDSQSADFLDWTGTIGDP